jgi:NADH-quinone oxidoreductase subunit N
VTTLGTFAGILSRPRSGRSIETIADLGGLARTDSATDFFLAMMMFSLAGVPALWPLVIGVLAGVVAHYYYLRIVKLMYFDEPAVAFDRAEPAARIVLAVSALIIIPFVFAPSPITNAATAAAQSLS